MGSVYPGESPETTNCQISSGGFQGAQTRATVHSGKNWEEKRTNENKASQAQRLTLVYNNSANKLSHKFTSKQESLFGIVFISPFVKEHVKISQNLYQVK